MAVNVFDDVYNRLKNNKSAQTKVQNSTAKANTAPVSTRSVTSSTSRRAGSTTLPTSKASRSSTSTTKTTSKSFIDTIKDAFSNATKVASQKQNGTYQPAKTSSSSFGSNLANAAKVVQQKQNGSYQNLPAQNALKSNIKNTIDSINKAYDNSLLGKLNNVGSDIGNSIRTTVEKATGLDKLNEAYKQNKQNTANTISKTLNTLAENAKTPTGIQKQHLDALFAGKTETDSVKTKISADPSYASKIMDQAGNMIDYTSDIDRLKGQLETTFDPYQRKEIKKQLTQLQEYQADQNKLLWSSYYDYLVKNGASEEDLNNFKIAVNKQDWNAIERTLGHFTSTVESYVGNTLKGYETLYKTVNERFGVNYEYSDMADMIINDAAEMAYYADQGASGAERFIHEVYGSSSNYLYALATSIFTGNALGVLDAGNLVGNEAAMNIANKAALLLSDVSVLGSQVKQNMDNGYSFETAKNNAFMHAALNHITESIGGESLANIITGQVGDQLFKNTVLYALQASANQFFSEAIEEGMEAAASPIIDKYTLNTGLTVQEYLNQVLSKDTAYQMFMGGIGGLAMGSGATAMTVYNVNQNVQTIADSIEMKTKKDYNAAVEAQKKLQQIVDEAQRNVKSETDQDQIFTTQMLLKAFNNKISEYRESHPYMDAISSAADDVDLDLNKDVELSISEAARPDISGGLHELSYIKQEVDEQNRRAIDTMQQNLNDQGINISAVEWSNLSDDAIQNVQIVNEYAKSLGRNVAFANIVSQSGEVIDGFYDNATGQIVINPNGQRSALSTLMHEFTHGTESSQYYDQLHNFVKEYLGDTYAEGIQRVKEEYSTVQNLTDEGAAHELVAITAQELLADPEFVDRLVRYNTSLAYKMYEEIRYANEYSGGAIEGIQQNFMRAFSSLADSEGSLETAIQYSATVNELNDSGKKIERAANFGEAVDAVLGGTFKHTNERVVVRTDTPQVLVNELGYENLPMVMGIGHIKSAVGQGKGKNQHHLSPTQLKMIPELMEKPQFIYYNEYNNSNNLVLDLYAADDEGNLNPVIVAVSLDSSKEYYNAELNPANTINTVFDYEGYENDLDDLLSKIVYPKGIKKEELIASKNRHSRQDSRQSSSINNISDISDEVKDEMVKLSKGTQLEDLGRQKDLMAIHNLSETNLLKSIDLGGFAAPSIAVTKDSIPHDNYGSISLVFDKSTIDPARKENRVYGGDAWTGVYPAVEYDISLDELSKAADKVESIMPLRELGKLGNVGALLSPSSMNDLLNSYNGDPVEGLKNNAALKYAYLLDKGEGFEIPTKVGDIAVNSDLKPYEFEQLFDLLAQKGVDLAALKEMQDSGKLQDFAQSIVPEMTERINQAFIDKYPELNNKRLEKGLRPLAIYYEGSVNGNEMPWYEIIDALNDTIRYWEEGARTVIDTAAFNNQINNNFDQTGYENWLRDLFSDVQIEKGIRNGKDYYTSTGTRRSFKQLHDPYTLENIMKIMKKQAGNDSRGVHEGVFGIGAGDIQATQKIDFKSIAEIISHEEMLQNLSDEEVESIIKPSMDKISEVSNMIESIYLQNSGRTDTESIIHMSNDAMEFLKEAIKKNTKAQMISYYQKEFAPYPYLRFTDEQLNNVLDSIINLKEELRNMPTRYFEAKPIRIVGLDEIQTAVIPSTSSDVLKQRLSDLGINTIEYDPEIEGDRSNKINSLENLKFSKGLSLEEINSAARKELRSVSDRSRRVNLKEDVNAAINDILQYGDVTQATYEALRENVVESTLAKVPNDMYDIAQDIRKIMGGNFLPKERWDATMDEINSKYAIFDEHSFPTSYIDARDMINDYLSGIGGKYLYLSPVQQGNMSEMEYEQMIDEKLDQVLGMLRNSVTDEEVNDAEIRTDIAEALGQNASEYVDQMVMQDALGNNEAVDRMRSSLYYQEMENMAYQRGQQDLDALMNEEDAMQKAIEEASAGSFTPEAIDQLEQDLLSEVTIDKAKEETTVLKEVRKDTNKPMRSWKDKGIWYQIRQKIFDKGIAIRDLKNAKVSASYDMLLSSDNMANYAILEGGYDNKGHKVVDSLTQISGMIPQDQKNDFDYYMYHKHNIDAAKIGKPVFFNFDSAMSEQIVNQYEMAHPEWIDIAQKYYDFNDFLLKRQVDAGVISQETANRWKEIYPHYVPTKRAMEAVDESSIIETADPLVQSSNKGTLYERTGGNSPIQPLDYAMAEHTKQIYKSSLFNKFAKDYVAASHAKTTLFNEDRSFDENIIEGNEDQVTKADEYTPATLIYYMDGDRHIVEIPKEIFDAVDKTQTPFNLPSEVPFLSWASSLRRNIITGANPVFWATNALKDFQDIAFNSKYKKDTYGNLIRAYTELIKDGEMARLYKSLGGEYNTYRSDEGIKQNDHGAFYNATIGNFVKFNDLIESAPRLAEFMSSLDHGDSLETAMYNAAEVTTNFKRGGDYAKWFNRNGFTFLNASIQGLDKQIRNISDAYDSKGWKGIASYMVKANLISGIPLIVLNGLLHRDDDDYDKLSDYIKDNYYILWKYDDGKFVRIPKGRIANAYQGIQTALYENGIELVGDDKATDKARKIWENTLDSLVNVWEQIGINDPLSNNIFAPIFQTINNEAWYGDPIVSSYMQKKDPADQYDESTDIFSVWLGQKANLSPKKINYLIDQYSGGVGDVVLPMLTPKAETRLDDGTLIGSVTSAALSPFVDKFTTDSVFKNQDVTDFFALDEELTRLANKEHASDEAKLAAKYINSLQYQMNDLYAQKRAIYNDQSIPDNVKYDQARAVQQQIDDLARYGLDTYDQIDLSGYYADLNGLSYYKNTKGEWSKVDPDKEAEFKELGLTTQEKSDYFYVKNNINELREQIKADTPDGENADYRDVTLNAIKNSSLTPRVQNFMYDSYYSGKITDNINAMDLSDEDKLALKYANATAASVKDANGKTISNSKALGVADAYADAGLLDDVFDYIAQNGMTPADFGLTKTVYGYSYDKMASEYQKVYGQQFGTGSSENVNLSSINNKPSNYSSSSKKSSSRSKTSSRSSSRRSSSSSKAAKAAEKARKKRLKAMQKYMKTLRKSNGTIFDVLNKMTTIKDAETNVKKIMQNAYKG